MSRYYYKVTGIAVSIDNSRLKELQCYFLETGETMSSLDISERAVSKLKLKTMSDGSMLKEFHITDIALIAINDVPIEQWKTNTIARSISVVAASLAAISVMLLIMLFIQASYSERASPLVVFAFFTLTTAAVYAVLMFQYASPKE